MCASLLQPVRFVHLVWPALLLAGEIALPVASSGAENCAPRSCRWIGSFGQSASEPFAETPGVLQAPATLQGTLRSRLPLTLGGSRLQLRISNEAGTRPLIVAAVTVGIAGSADTAVRPGTLVRVTFGGHAGISIPPGAPALSDAVSLSVADLSSVVVSIHLPESIVLAQAPSGVLSAAVAGRDATLEDAPRDASFIAARPLISAIAVETPGAQAIVALGDSITDGACSKSRDVRGWPGRLAQRLAGVGRPPRYGVVNAGIGGNRLLANGMGINALGRFDRDVTSVPGVTHVIVLEGINDIGNSGSPVAGGENAKVTAEDLIAAFRQLIARAHQLGIQIEGGTILPFRGATSFSAEKEGVRQAVNRWMRTAQEFDGIVDFDGAIRDKADASRMAAAFDCGDHLHPNDAGYAAMSDTIDLRRFYVSGK
jgi:lysophospholipase L1-like esterase